MDPLVVAIAVLVSMSILAAALAVRAALRTTSEEVLARVDRVVNGATLQVAAPSTGSGRWAALVSPLARWAQPKVGTDDYSRAKQRLSYAGFRGPRAVEIFYATKLALAIALCAAVLFLSALTVEGLPRAQLWSVVLAALGFYAPSAWLESRVRAYQTALLHALPDTLDLLVTCVEAGLGLDAALARITQEVGLSSPVLALELGQSTSELQMGMARAEVFRRLAERTGLEELRSLAAVLIQAELFGTSVGKALRVHAVSMRVRRSHRAEEKAATVAVKMLLPLIFFILPSLFAVILGPAVVRIVRTLLPALSHGGGP